MSRSVLAVSTAVVALAAAACGYDDPMDGWGPGSPPAVVVTIAPVEAAAEPAPPRDAPAPSSESAGATEPDSTDTEDRTDAADPGPPPEPLEPPPPRFAPNGQTVRVRSLDNSFRGETVEVVVGTEVWWTNDGRNEHDVLPVDDDQDWGALRDVFQPGDEYRHTFLEPGVYDYYCSIHGTKEVGMVGTIVVTAP